MNNRAFGHLLRALVVAAGVGLSTSASAAPTLEFDGQRTSVALSTQLVSALTSLNVMPSPVFPSTLRRGVATFPIPSGELDLANAKGEVLHVGGLSLSTVGTRVDLTQFIIDTTGATGAVLTGLVKVNRNVVGRLPLFTVTLPSVTLPLPEVRRLVIPGVALALTDTAAQALNAAFDVNAFSAGIPIGTATLTATASRGPGRGH